MVPVADLSLMDGAQVTNPPPSPSIAQRPTPSKGRDRISAPPVGNLEVHVGHAKLLLLGHSLTSTDLPIKKFEWKVMISCDRNSKETKTSIMTRETQKTPYAWLPEVSKEAEAYTPLHEIHWDEQIQISDVHDIWADICIDLFWRKTGTDKTTKAGWKSDSLHSPKMGPTDLSPQDLQPEENQATALLQPQSKEDLISGTGHKPSLRNDFHPSKRKPPILGEWKIYGRTIVPLSSFLSSYGGVGSSSTRNLASSLYLMPDNGDQGSFWVHLFPHESNERKYYKPVAGYSGFGMSNPGTTLGFLKLHVRFTFLLPPLLAPVISTLSPPETRWVNSFTFEPQVNQIHIRFFY